MLSNKISPQSEHEKDDRLHPVALHPLQELKIDKHEEPPNGTNGQEDGQQKLVIKTSATMIKRSSSRRLTKHVVKTTGNQTMDALLFHSKYAWITHGSFREKMRAFKTKSHQLDLDEEELELCKTLLEKATNQHNFHLADFFSLVYTNENTDHPLCDAQIRLVESHFLGACHSLQASLVKAMQDFVTRIISLICTRSTGQQGRSVITIGDRSYKGTSFLASKTGTNKRYNRFMDEGLAHLPGRPALASCCKDFFSPVDLIPENSRVFVLPYLVMTGFKAYQAACRLCLTDKDEVWGLCENDEQGEFLQAWFKTNGIDLATIESALSYTAPGHKMGFAFELHDKKFKLEGLARTRGMGTPNASESYIANRLHYLGLKGQEICRSRYYVLMASLRRELVHIRAVRHVKGLAMQKSLALMVTIGVGLATWVGNYLTYLIV